MLSIEGRVVLRYAVTVLFLWFGYQQLVDPASWTPYLPEWTGYFPITGEMLVQLNGWLELVGAVLLGLGLFTRLTAAILGVHLLFIALSLGGALGVRDAVLALATLTLALDLPDIRTLDAYLCLPSKNLKKQ